MKRCLLVLLVLLQISLVATAQKRTVSGVVRGAENAPLEGVTVTLKGTTTTTRTNAQGAYSLSVSGNNSLLVFSSVGYDEQTVNAGTKTSVNVTLNTRSAVADEVVIVGYGTQRKKDVTVSIEKVNMNDLNKAPVRSFDEALAGRVAGVQVTSSDGQPGSPTNIVVRGNNSITQSNSPLYIIDGFPVEGANNNILNPQDIESIEVLKDASATAIYGSRGANGVIIITTKKGKEGPPVISFTTSYSFQDATKKIKMMSPYEFVRFQIERDTSAAGPTALYLTNAGKSLEDYKTYPALDWQSKVEQTAPMQNYTLSLSGGTATTKYIISGSVLDQDGIIINSNYTRYQGRFQLDQKVGSKLSVGLNANYSYLKQSGVTIASSTNSGTTNVMYGVWGYRPLQTSGLELSDLLFDPAVNTSNDYRINPYINLQNAVNNNFTKSLLANVYADYTITPELKLRVTGGVRTNDTRTDIFNNSKTQRGNPVTQANGVNGSITYGQNNSLLNENSLTWNKRINSQNSLTLVGVASVQKGVTNSYGTSATQLPNEELGLNGLSQGIPQSITSGASEWTLASFAGRLNYNLMSRYYLTASYRADGSSRFAPGKRWGYFPSVSLAWRFTGESFLKKQQVLSDGKLRIGYGANGNNRVSDFAYLSIIALPTANAYTINNSVLRGAVPTSIGNADLKWETTTDINLGLDLSFLQGRISLTTEAYRKKTKDLLLNASLPTSSGYSSAFKNIGSVQNEGLEFTLNTTNVRNRKFSWTSNFNIAFNRNKVTGLNDNQEALTVAMPWDNNWNSVPAYLAKLNNPLGLIYGYVWDGVYQYSDFNKNTAGGYVLKDNVPTNGNSRSSIQPGDIRYKDINGDGVVNSSDYAVIGRGIPKFTGGLSNNFTYRGFDLNIFFQWSYGNDVLNVNRLVFEGNALTKTNLNQYASYVDRWSPDNQDAKLFRNKGFFGGGYSSLQVEDGSYLRLKTAALGYTSAKVLNRLGIKSFRIYVAAQNLYTWTNYSGLDPEVNVYNSALTPGFDWSPYPRARTLTVGANINF